jgi:uncharacterized glyoxalase superfamily protein PhnB
MSQMSQNLGATVRGMRPVVPAKEFEISNHFYMDLGFTPIELTGHLVEMRLGEFRFLLQDYYAKEWAENSVVHLLVSDVRGWWEHIVSLDLSQRHGVRITAPVQEDWGLVAGVVDPSGVLWRIES